MTAMKLKKTPKPPDLNQLLRRGFEACLTDIEHETGVNTNPRTLGLKAKRPSSALYAWLNGRAGISWQTLNEWIVILGITPHQFLRRCVAINAGQAYNDLSSQKEQVTTHATVEDAMARIGAEDIAVLRQHIEAVAERAIEKHAARLALGLQQTSSVAGQAQSGSRRSSRKTG
jgi:hypothetical protein